MGNEELERDDGSGVEVVLKVDQSCGLLMARTHVHILLVDNPQSSDLQLV